MAYSDPGDLASGAVITEAWVDAVRADILASAVAIVTTKGDIVAATEANVIARLGIGADDSTLVAASGEATGIKWQIQPACRLTQAADQSVGGAAFAALTFDTEVYDTDTMHSPTVEPTRITCPDNGDGIYHIQGNIEFDNNGGTGAQELAIQILLNGATVLAEVYANANEDDANISLYVATDYVLSDNGAGANDYVELLAYTEKNDNIKYISAHTPVFSARWVRMP